MSARFRIEPILEEFGASITPRSSKINCPFHDDENASGYIPESREYFKCLADCGAKGDAVRLLHDYRMEDGAPVQGGLSWRDAYARAEELAGKPGEQVPATPVRSGRVPGRTRDYRGHSRYGTTRSAR